MQGEGQVDNAGRGQVDNAGRGALLVLHGLTPESGLTMQD